MPEQFPHYRLNMGHVSSRPSTDHEPGELFRSIGVEYMPGDTVRAWRLKGRKLFGQVGAGNNEPRGVALCNFDNGSDKIVTLAGTSLHSATPGETGTFNPVANSRVDQKSVFLSAAHMNDEWFLVTGADKNSVLTDDGTVRDMGLDAPTALAPISRALEVGNVQRAEAHLNGSGSQAWDDPLSAYDDPVAFPESYAKATLQAPGKKVCIWEWNTVDSSANRLMRIKWWITGSKQNRTAENVDNPFYIEGFTATVKVELSGDYTGDPETANWNEKYFELVDRIFMKGYEWLSIPVVANNSVTAVRVTLQYLIGTRPATIRIEELKIDNGSLAGAFTLPDGIKIGYAYTERDPSTGRESPPSPVNYVTFSNENAASLNFAAIPQTNPSATQRGIYRTTPIVDGDPGAIARLGRVDTIDITENTWRDTFDVPYDEQAFPLIEMVEIRVGNSSLLYVANQPPPQLSHIASYGGALVGVNGRRFYRSLSGRPESWPGILVIDAFPLPENDNLIATQQLGTSLLIGASGAMMMIDDLPRIISGQFLAPTPRVVSSYGVVGPLAMTVFSFGSAQEDVAAWVSESGIHITNGVTSRKVTEDIDWAATFDGITDKTGFVLEWIQDTEQVVFAYDSDGDGVNDRYALLHMNASHRKSNGQPKITWGHYGSIGCMTSGRFGGKIYTWSGHGTRGEVYTERTGDVDESNSFDASGGVRMDAALRINGDWSLIMLHRGRITHTDGDGDITVEASSNIDIPGSTDIVARTVTLEPGRRAEFLIDREAEYVDLAFQKTGGPRFAISDVQLHADVAGESGEIIDL